MSTSERPCGRVAQRLHVLADVLVRRPDELAGVNGALAPGVHDEIDVILRQELAVRAPQLEGGPPQGRLAELRHSELYGAEIEHRRGLQALDRDLPAVITEGDLQSAALEVRTRPVGQDETEGPSRRPNTRVAPISER